MATSGTTDFTLDLAEIVEEAYERCGGELRSGYDMRTARRSLNLLLADWANRGLNMWTIDEGSLSLLTGVYSYTLPADTVDLLEHVIRTNEGNVSLQSDLVISRISVSTYAAIPNKLIPGRPIQLYVDRAQAAPVVHVWPVPPDNTYKLSYWRLRRLQDAGDGATTQDVPFRFAPALTAGLAYYLAMKVPGALARLPELKEQYADAMISAQDEDRDKSSVRFVPRVFS